MIEEGRNAVRRLGGGKGRKSTGKLSARSTLVAPYYTAAGAVEAHGRRKERGPL